MFFSSLLSSTTFAKSFRMCLCVLGFSHGLLLSSSLNGPCKHWYVPSPPWLNIHSCSLTIWCRTPLHIPWKRILLYYSTEWNLSQVVLKINQYFHIQGLWDFTFYLLSMDIKWIHSAHSNISSQGELN